MDLYEFYSGRCFDAYNELGAHVVKENVGKSRRKAVTGVDFVTYAPNAESVTVTCRADCRLATAHVCRKQPRGDT